MKNDAKVEIKETDNGWIVETNYSCYGGEKVKVFTEWQIAINWVAEALRATTDIEVQAGDD